MGIGPVPASKATLKAAGMELKDMDICEVGVDRGIELWYIQKTLQDIGSALYLIIGEW